MKSKGQSVRIFYKVASIVGVLLTVAVCIWGVKKGFFRSADVLGGYVRSTGAWAPILFVLIQIIQVVIPIIPGGISLLAGVIIFGPFWGFMLNYTGIVIGSMIAFLIVRRLGRPFLESITSKGLYEKYIGWLDKGTRFEKAFAIAILMPVAPDDFLCMLAGLTKMSFKKLTAILLLCKPPTIIVYSLGLSAVTAWVMGFFA